MTTLPDSMSDHASISALKPRRLSKGFYLGWIIGSFALFFVCFVPGFVILIASGNSNGALVGAGLACFSFVPVIVGTVFHMILVYRMWSAIQGGVARTTPGKAVGFLFIPFFNLYWMFQAYWGWAVDYNRTASAVGFHGPPASEGLGLAYGILTLCSMVPYLGSLAGLAGLVILLIFLADSIDRVNALTDAVFIEPRV